VLDEIKANANLLVIIAEAKFVVEAVQVKLLTDPNHIEDFGNI